MRLNLLGAVRGNETGSSRSSWLSRMGRLALGGCLSTASMLSFVMAQEVTLTKTEILSEADEAALRVGLAQITEKSVEETIKFLASDELEGRDTLSAGYDKAADYAVQRFLRAGLRPGSEDSFFHVTKLPVTRVPTEGVAFNSSDDQALEHYGLLGSGDSPVQYQGKITAVDFATEEAKLEAPGPVLAEWKVTSNAPRVLNQIVRASNRWRQAGATAIILRVARDSPLIDAARERQTMNRPEDARTKFNLPVLLVPDDLPWDATREFKLGLPAQQPLEAEARNVIAILPGSDPELAKEFIVFSAHLDHIGVAATGEDRIFNGADDNATGVTTVLTLADAFAALPKPPQRTLVFLLFWGEERGLLGSRAFVKTPAIPLDKIIANINIEMVGRPEEGAYGKTWVTGWDKSDLGALMHETSQAVGVDIFEHPRFSAMLYGSSDNLSFVEAGVIAHSFSAGSLHEDYHQVGDEWEKLNLPHMTKVIQGLFAGSWRLVQGEVTPQKAAAADNERRPAPVGRE
ncbi:MAG: M28 family peptidase [Planctomycetaceae bacterium]|nr:M28 family peptidase [Planctomycetaceae bacterium]